MQPIVVKSHHVQVRTTPLGEARTNAPVCGVQEPSVRLLREGGVVHAIEVRCACGRPTVVQLDYEQTPPVPTSPVPTSPPSEAPLNEASPNETPLTEAPLTGAPLNEEVE